MEEPKIDLLKKHYGAVKDLIAPSGKRFIIREQNGNDDDILSSPDLQKDNDNSNVFIVGIVVWTDFTSNNKLLLSDLSRLAVKDKYFILFSSRIFSIDSVIKFTYNWGEANGGEVDYTEDLNKYLWDYSKPDSFPKKGSDNYFKHRLRPYSVNPYEKVETTLGNKKIRFDLANVSTEKKLAKKGNDISRNDNLLAMNMELWVEDDNKWVSIENFKFFNKREMIKLNKLVNDLEEPFYGFSEIENPKDGNIEVYPLIVDPAFFFPLEI